MGLLLFVCLLQPGKRRKRIEYCMIKRFSPAVWLGYVHEGLPGFFVEAQ